RIAAAGHTAPASQQQGTRRPASQPPQKRSAKSKRKRNTRLYLFLIALVLIVLLVIGIVLLKDKNKNNRSAGTASDTTETTTTTEPIVTEPPVVQEITFNTPSMYSVMGGAELVDYNGDQKMRVLSWQEAADQGAPEGTSVQDESNALILFDLEQLVGSAKVGQIRTVSMDITCESSGPIGQCSSGLRALVPQYNAETGEREDSKSVKITDILLIDNESSVNTWHVALSIPKDVFGGDVRNLAFVRYADDRQTELYLDNIRFLDAYGNPIDVTYNASGAPTGANTVPPAESTTTTTSAAPAE
ncbi:MAG: hypothetical protein IJ060_09110, partial [Oscillospiraceae bacterium]|nr:hypothetical protein [Oscillospiraceae bacterium]